MRFRAACFRGMLVAAPLAMARTSLSGSVGRMRRAKGVGSFGLRISATRTSRLANQGFVLRMSSAA